VCYRCQRTFIGTGASKHIDWGAPKDAVIMRDFRRLKWALVAACASLFASSVAYSQLGFVSEKEIRRQARVEWLSMKRHIPLEPNPRVQAYVQCVANRLIAVLDEQHADVDWEVVVFDDDSVNASANPDGKIAVLNGLLKIADTPDALAAVLGHEIAHATENHVMDRARKGARTDMLVLLGGAVTGMPDVARDVGAIGLVLPYAREQESEADRVGLQYMAKAGFDPRAAMYLWKNMATVNKNSPPEFLSSHPSDDVRLGTIVRSITPALIEYNKAHENGRRPNCAL
jgi:predicted Zn-dependent protease